MFWFDWSPLTPDWYADPTPPNPAGFCARDGSGPVSTDHWCCCRCHVCHDASGSAMRTDPIAAVLACDLCRHLHCPALSSRQVWQPPAPPE